MSERSTNPVARRVSPGLLLAVAALAGCSTTSIYDLFPGKSNTALTDTARAVRQPFPADVPRELAKIVHPPFTVEPGDGLLIQPEELDSPVRLPNDQTVLPDGTIDLGRYGRLVAAGKTLPQIEQEVRAAVEKETPDAGFISVRLISRQSKVYYVLGEVNTPGSFPLSGRETVLDAIVAAGGLTSRASRNNIILSRPTPPGSGRVVLPVCYPAIVQLGDTSTNYQIAAGDRIFVPRAGFWEGCFGGCEEDGSCPHLAARKGRAAPLAAPTPKAAVLGAPVGVPPSPGGE
ncbi:MAG TPA: polysaccharide biosynthesis/export family protein [Gemmataceae bacterium]